MPTPVRGRLGGALAVLGVGEAALLGWWAATRAGVLLVLGQGLLLALLALVLLAARYRGFRRAHEQDVARSAVLRERVALAEDLHDVLGHELSLVAVRAGALQVSTTGPAAEQAAQVRRQVEQAVLQLRQTVQLLRAAGPSPVRVEPAGLDVPALVDRARRAGLDVTTSGRVDPDVPAPVRLTACRLVQEGLTNAARHAPGASVDVRLRTGDGVLDVAVATRGGPADGPVDGPVDVAADDPAGWSGLATLHRRVAALGGELQVLAADGSHLTRARIPLSSSGAAGSPTPPDPLGDGPAPRRPGAATARWALLPAATAGAVLVGFYVWATSGAVLEPAAYERLAGGQPVARAHAVLPDRQAPVRLTRTAPVPPGWRCRSFTDGNFPLGMAAFEVCDDGVRVTRVTDLRKLPLR